MVAHEATLPTSAVSPASGCGIPRSACPCGAVVDRSETFEDFEQIEASLAMSNRLAAGTYFIEVFGFNNTNTNNYTMTLTITP